VKPLHELQVVKDACSANLCRSIWLDFDGFEDLLDLERPMIDCKQRDWRRIDWGFLQNQIVHIAGSDSDQLMSAKRRIALFRPKRLFVHYVEIPVLWDSQIDA